MQLDKTHILAERIARILEGENSRPNLASIQAGIDKINERLEKVESAMANPHSAIRSQQLTHPSADRFAIAEAIADDVFGKLQKEKACTFEPNGKPCDHCAMCSSRGF